MTWWVSAVIAILGGGTVGGIVALATLPMQRRKLSAEGSLTEAQAAEILSRSSVALLEPAHEEIKRLRTELQEARAEAQELRTQISLMSKDLIAANDELERLRAAG